MNADSLKKFIKTLKDTDKENFKLGNKVLMALTHITLTKISNGDENLGITKDEVLDTLNKFDIKDKFFETKKSKYTDADTADICMQVFLLSIEGMVKLNENDIEHIHLTDKGGAIGIQSFKAVRPMEFTVVYKYAIAMDGEMLNQQQLRNN
jgi:hypothetical protein